jgi:cytochrome c oxidase cbb3-type subunit 3
MSEGILGINLDFRRHFGRHFGTAFYLLTFATNLLQSQTPAPAVRHGGFVPGQHREPGDPAQIERGKTIYGINCAICHGADLRGGDMGGPNLLRSQVALSDLHGENILPIIQGSRQSEGMPAIPIKPEDGLAVAAYVRSVLEMIGRQGTPPDTGRPAPSVLVGNVKEGQAYFAAKCASCHSTTGDLSGLATRVPDPRDLQTAWVSGEIRNEINNARRGNPDPDAVDPRAVTASVALPSGERVEGRLLHIDDFLVTVRSADGAIRSFTRRGADPNVELHDPMKVHRDLLTQYNDRDIHDVTAYLNSLK